MKKWTILLTVLFMLGCREVRDQNQLKWENYIRSFHDADDSELIGYISDKGDTVLPAEYNPVFSNHIIYNVGAVSSLDKEVGGYYINKYGKIFGKDSLWAFDFSYDVECEGFIRFSVGGYPDYDTKRVGIFDRNGSIRVPNVYNELSTVKNGLIFGLRDAKNVPVKEGSEYRMWIGGRSVLLDTNATVLVNDSLEMKKLTKDHINFYSLRRSPDSLPDRINVRTVQGDYLSFETYQSEFVQFIRGTAGLDVLLLDTILVQDYRTRDKWERSKERNDDRVARADFLGKEEHVFFRNMIQTVISQVDISMRLYLEDLPRVTKSAYQNNKKGEMEEVLYTYTYDFMKPFKEIIPRDEPYMKIPIFELVSKDKKNEVLFARCDDGTYKIIAACTKEH